MLLLAHRCALVFLFILSVRWSVGGCSARFVRSYAFLFVVYGHLTSQGLSLSALATSSLLAAPSTRRLSWKLIAVNLDNNDGIECVC